MVHTKESNILSVILFVSMGYLVSAQEARDPACGPTEDIRTLLQNPPPGYHANCFNRRQSKQFLESQDIVDGLVNCITENICGEPGYPLLIDVLRTSFGSNFNCNSSCGKNKKLIDFTARRFRKLYPQHFRRILKTIQANQDF